MATLLPAPLPWAPPGYTDDIVYSIRALADGKANQGQQVAAWEYLMFITGASDAYADLSFRPEEQGGERATAFAEGKRFVGLMLRKLFRPELTPKESQMGKTTPARAQVAVAMRAKAKTKRKTR